MSIPLPPATVTLVCRTGEKTEGTVPRDVLLYRIASESPLPAPQERQKTEGKNVRGSGTEKGERVVDTDEARKKGPPRSLLVSMLYPLPAVPQATTVSKRYCDRDERGKFRGKLHRLLLLFLSPLPPPSVRRSLHTLAEPLRLSNFQL